MNLYEKYFIKYRESVNLSKATTKNADYEVNPDVWITFKYLGDVNVNPWELDKLQALIEGLYDRQEHEMIQHLALGLRTINTAIFKDTDN